MKHTYRVERGPVWPPTSIYGAMEPLQTGDTLRSEGNAWLRRCLADGRLVAVESSGKRRKKGAANA